MVLSSHHKFSLISSTSVFLEQTLRVSISGEVETQLHEIHKQTNWLNKVLLSLGSFLDLLASSWFGSWGPWLMSAFQTTDIVLFLTMIIVFQICMLSQKFFYSCRQPLASDRWSASHWNEKRTEKHNQL